MNLLPTATMAVALPILLLALGHDCEKPPETRLQVQSATEGNQILDTTANHKQVLIVHQQKHLQLWDGATGRLIWQRYDLQNHHGMQGLFINKDRHFATVIASLSGGMFIDVWETASGKHLQRQPFIDTCLPSLALTPNGDAVTSCIAPQSPHPAFMMLWPWNGSGFDAPRPVPNGQQKHRMHLAFQPGGDTMLDGSNDLRKWPSKDPVCTIAPTSFTPWTHTYSPDGRYLTISRQFLLQDTYSMVWKTDTCALHMTVKGQSPIFDAASRHLIVTHDNAIHSFRLSDATAASSVILEQNGEPRHPYELVTGPGVNHVYVVMDRGEIHLIDLTHPTSLSILGQTLADIAYIEMDPKQDTLALILDQGPTLNWSLSLSKPVEAAPKATPALTQASQKLEEAWRAFTHQRPQNNTDWTARSPSGHYEVVMENTHRLRVTNAVTGTLLYNVAFAPNGDYIAWTPEGRFKATPGRASDFAHVVQKNRVITDPDALKPFETHDLLGNASYTKSPH